MAEELHAFVDEAGQRRRSPGSSAHFTLGAVVWGASWDPGARALLADLRRITGRKPGDLLHFQRFNHHQRLAACREIASHQDRLTVLSVTICKNRVEGPDLEEDMVYLWTLRVLLERLSWLARSGGSTLTYTLAHVVRFKKEKLLRYEQRLRNLPDCTIAWAHLPAPGRIDQPQSDERLQLADIVASATWQAFEEQQGFSEPRYVQELAPALYRPKGRRVTSYGLKVNPRLGDGDHLWITGLQT